MEGPHVLERFSPPPGLSYLGDWVEACNNNDRAVTAITITALNLFLGLVHMVPHLATTLRETSIIPVSQMRELRLREKDFAPGHTDEEV